MAVGPRIDFKTSYNAGTGCKYAGTFAKIKAKPQHRYLESWETFYSAYGPCDYIAALATNTMNSPIET